MLLQQFGAVKGNASSAFALSWAKLLEHIGKGRRGERKRGMWGVNYQKSGHWQLTPPIIPIEREPQQKFDRQIFA